MWVPLCVHADVSVHIHLSLPSPSSITVIAGRRLGWALSQHLTYPAHSFQTYTGRLNLIRMLDLQACRLKITYTLLFSLQIASYP